MKKLSIFLLGALGMMAASCDEAPAVATPQSNAQEPILTAGDVTSSATGVLASTSVLNLEDYSADYATIPVMKLDATENLPEGATVSYKLQLSDSEDFARSVTLDASSVVDGNYTVLASEWNEAHVYLFGKSPKVKTAYYRVPVYVNLDGSDYRFKATDFYAASGAIQETCMDMGFVIEDHYYLLSNGTTWDLTQASAYVFDHSESDPYDDPVFTIKFEVTQDVLDANGGGDWWKIAPESALTTGSWDNVLGPETDSDENLAGILVDTNAQAGKITVAGKYKMTINVEEMTYDIQLMLQPDLLYTPGGSNGWSQTSSAWMQLHSDKGYYGCFPIGDYGFKICSENNWDDATTYGDTGDGSDLTGTLTNPGNNIGENVEKGVYWCFVQFDPLSYELTTYSLTKIETVGLIGSFSGSGWGSDLLMTSADDGNTWTADLTINSGEEFKVRFNGDWSYNFGGELNQLTLDGSNISCTESGTYTVTLSLQPGYPKLTMVKK